MNKIDVGTVSQPLIELSKHSEPSDQALTVRKSRAKFVRGLQGHWLEAISRKSAILDLFLLQLPPLRTLFIKASIFHHVLRFLLLSKAFLLQYRVRMASRHSKTYRYSQKVS